MGPADGMVVERRQILPSSSHNPLPRLAFDGVDFAYPGGAPLIRGFSLAFPDAGAVALLGPNGSGKSTLIHLAAGLVAPSAGTVRIDGRDLAAAPRAWIARRVALVPQEHAPGFGFTAREIILMGRTPHVGLLGLTGDADRLLVAEATARLELAPLLDRDYTRLSGGERKRVLLARALVQATPILLLDEPDAHLDIRHRHRFLAHVRRLAAGEGKLCLFSVHDPELAARYADHVLLLSGPDHPPLYGTAADVLGEGALEAAYGLPFRRLRLGGRDLPLADPDRAVEPATLPEVASSSN